MASVLVPVLYVGIVISSLLVFSHFYRKRSTGKLYEPYFPSHPERDVYVTLLQQADPPAHEALLKAALLRRAMTDVSRVAEKELEAEIMEVVGEANSFVEGWGGIIFQTAGEVLANEKMRSIYEDTAAARARKEQKYGKVGKTIDLPTLNPTVTAGPPPPGSLPAAMLAAMQAQAQAQGRLAVPTSAPEKPLGGLTPPASGRPESVVSSDGDGEPTRSPSKSASAFNDTAESHFKCAPQPRKNRKRK
ncbi:Pre protein translocase subunit Sec66-domain-containing protein [Pisolithus marmoratus]|nr:Pre protein translocase subunit Sec66-domain-containing protein [Pisolithus marmoratus]